MKHKRFFSILSLSFCFLMLTALEGRAESGALEPMKIDKDFPSGCGCSIQDAKDQFLVSSELPTRNAQGKMNKPPAIVKIGGKRQELNFVSSTEKNGPPKLGDSFSRVYEKGDIRLVLNYKTTFVCPPKSESCEVTRYSVDGILKIGNKSTKLSSLKGDCGC